MFRALVEKRDLESVISIDSAGTGDWHIGRGADPRAISAALERGYDLSALRARQAIAADFREFDYILAMDESNLSNLQALAPANYQGHLGLFLDFAADPDSTQDKTRQREVPDPYYGADDGFQTVLDLIEKASEGLLEHILRHRQ